MTAKKDTSVQGWKKKERVRPKVQRHSPQRLLRKPVVLPGGITVSAEKHKGRLVVRVESPDNRPT